jgi:photosystem II protein PsbQ
MADPSRLDVCRAGDNLATLSVATPPPGTAGPLAGLGIALRRLALLAVAVLLSISLAACDGSANRAAPTIAPEDMAMITRQAEGFLSARDRLPELATLVNQRNWTFTRNLIHGPMQEVGRQMLYINKLLLPADRTEATARADKLKTALAELDEAARLQDAESLRKAYISVASSFGRYAQVLPEEVKVALKQV